MQPTVAVFGILRFPPERMLEVRPHLKTLVEATYRTDGCIAYDVGEDPFDPDLSASQNCGPITKDSRDIFRHHTSNLGGLLHEIAVC